MVLVTGAISRKNAKLTHPMLPFPIAAAIWHFLAPRPGAELQLFPSPTCERNKKEQGTVSDGACEGGDFKDENSKGTHPMLPFPIVAAI